MYNFLNARSRCDSLQRKESRILSSASRMVKSIIGKNLLGSSKFIKVGFYSVDFVHTLIRKRVEKKSNGSSVQSKHEIRHRRSYIYIYRRNGC